MVAGAPLTQTHRRAQLVLRSQVMRDLAKLWPALDWSDINRTFPAWENAVGTLIRANRSRSSALAAAYLRAFRAAQGVDGDAAIVLAEAIEADRLRTVLEITARASVRAAAVRGVAAEAAMAHAFVRSSGAATRLVLEGGRETLRQSIEADPQATGYQRVTSGNPCSFCRQVADWAKGNDALNSDFRCHDHCGCSLQPTWS